MKGVCMERVVTVSKLNAYIKSIIERNPHLTGLLVGGEISNFKHHSSGHLYMSLKDDSSLVRAVMFRSSASKLKFVPENGMKVIVRCRVSVYERDGQYQLYIDEMQPDGVGALNLAFEQLKEKLEKEGLFSSDRKKPIPAFPRAVGVITSPTGAAVRDMINVLTRRFPSATIVFAPVLVQGDGAPPEIIDAIKRFNAAGCADVLIVGRGGGSIEELWAFNDEGVARAVADSKIPVISAVGHETDFTICDFAADLRAPTPSAAAELAVPNTLDLRRHIRTLSNMLEIRMNKKVQLERARLEMLTSNPCMKSPQSMLYERRLMLDNYTLSMIHSIKKKISDCRVQFTENCAKLDMLSPLKVLSRGYAIPFKDESVIRSIDDVKIGDNIDIKIADGDMKCAITDVAVSKESRQR